jgi:hypothetical protein
MYNFTLLDEKSKNFIVKISNTGMSKNISVSIGVSKVLSNRLAMPSSPVDDIESFYRQNHELSVIYSIDVLNELLVVDAECIKDITKRLYLVRYGMLSPKDSVLILPGTAVEDFFGIRKYMSDSLLNTVRLESASIMETQNAISSILTSLDKNKTGV